MSWANGTCDRGSACGFAHGASELRRIEHDSGNFSGPPGCVDCMKGTCGKGEMCSFNHNRNVIQNRFAEEYNLDPEMPLNLKQKYVQASKGLIQVRTQDVIEEWENMRRRGSGCPPKELTKAKGRQSA